MDYTDRLEAVIRSPQYRNDYEEYRLNAASRGECYWPSLPIRIGEAIPDIEKTPEAQRLCKRYGIPIPLNRILHLKSLEKSLP